MSEFQKIYFQRLKVATKKISALVIAGLFVIGIFSVSASGQKQVSPAPGSSTSTSKWVLGVALPNQSNPYYVAQQQEALAVGKKYGFSVKMAIANDSDTHQLSQIDAFISQHVNAVVLNAVDSGPGAAEVKALNAAHIPVITENVTVDPNAMKKLGAHIIGYVGPDQVAGGRTIGEELLSAVGQNAHLVVGIVGDPQQIPTNQRDQGFEEALKSDPNAKVVALVNGLVQPTTSLRVTTDMLEGHPNMNVVFADTGPAAIGAVKAIESQNLVGKVSLYGFTTAKADVKLIENNSIFKAGVAQDPRGYMRIAIKEMAQYLNGKTVPAKTLLPLIKVTKKNAATFYPNAV